MVVNNNYKSNIWKLIENNSAPEEIKENVTYNPTKKYKYGDYLYASEDDWVLNKDKLSTKGTPDLESIGQFKPKNKSNENTNTVASIASISNINNFLSAYGVSNNNRYIFTLTPPNNSSSTKSTIFSTQNKQWSSNIDIAINALQSAINVASNGLYIACKEVSLPGRTVITRDYRTYGFMVKIPYALAYEVLGVKLLCTDNMAQRKLFDYWHSIIVDTSTQYAYYYEDYVGQIRLDKISTDGKSIVDSYIFEDVIPINVSSTTLSYEKSDLIEIDVSFSYKRWYKEDIDQLEQKTNKSLNASELNG